MRKKIALAGNFFCILTLGLVIGPSLVRSQTSIDVHQATLMETDQKTKEISTEELRRIISEKSATVFDTRPFKEFAMSHIPGAVNVSPKQGVPISLYVSDVAEMGRLLKGEKSAPIVLYCNGPFCGKSKRLAAELVENGYTNVRRYQLGIPVWRALGGVTQIEPAGIKSVMENDRTAVFIDARDSTDFKAGTIPSAKNLPRSLVKEGKDVGEVKAAKDDGRLPMEDHNTRIIVFGKTSEQARGVAEALAKEAFHNVSFFAGAYDELRTSLRK
jgi:rhodanese-related sulfurtransferase